MIGMGPLAAPHGGFASAIAIDASRLYRVRTRIDDIDAAILEPATVAVHAVRRTDIRLGDSVVVLGAGPIGLLVLQAARAAGAGTVVLVEPQRSRRELGGTLGADKLIDPVRRRRCRSDQRAHRRAGRGRGIRMRRHSAARSNSPHRWSGAAEWCRWWAFRIVPRRFTPRNG